ncbi:38437_t:CDS:2 [Gigaspora margarita]|uniref:38437_t:CDS:1 n=1 Tax=Gigaspora margarita TaxID=4874 RepID=A0ABN7UDR5_GIGMA|nr:38437_t:CDS:2 [Gigaspora margarita]
MPLEEQLENILERRKKHDLSSRLLDGNSSYAESLDTFLAEFHNHNNVENLNVIMKIGAQSNIFVMDVDISPLKEIVEVLKPFNAYLYVDEALIEFK